jgi:hypothetical protein
VSSAGSKGKGKAIVQNGYEEGEYGEGGEDEDMFDGGDGSGERSRSREKDVGNGRGRLIDESLACRYLAAQCLVGFHPGLGVWG